MLKIKELIPPTRKVQSILLARERREEGEMTKLYYTPPSEEAFTEVKEKAIEIWRGYDDTHGYPSEKIKRIKDIQNVGENFMYIVAMFDQDNQRNLARLLSEPTRKAIRERMIDGGHPEYMIVF